MNINYQINKKPTIIFGDKSLGELKNQTIKYNKIMLVYGQSAIKKIGLYQEVIDILGSKVVCELEGVTPNPRLSIVEKGIKQVIDNDVDLILAIGGGSVIDCAKAIAIGSKHSQNIWDVITQNLIVSDACDLATIPTMVATGSETNDIFVIYNDYINLKRSMRSYHVSPVFSILNPNYTKSVSKRQTTNGIVDALSHILEQAVNTHMDNYYNKQLAFYFKQLLHTGKLLVDDLDNYKLRSEHMLLAMNGYNGDFRTILVGDWACHGMDYGLASEFDNYHGEGLSIITPNWLNYIANNNDHYYDLPNFFRYVFDLDISDDKEVMLVAAKTLRGYLKEISAPAYFEDINISVDNNIIEIMADKAQFIKPLGNTFNLDTNDIKNIYKKCIKGDI